MQFIIELLKGVPVFMSLTLAALATIAGDYAGKLWSVHQQPWVFMVAMVLYAMSGLFFLPTLLKEGLVVTSLIWTILTVIGFLIIGTLIFHEQLTTIQWAGVGLGWVS
jgi:multidrug transporter EmrE-like cation transporter